MIEAIADVVRAYMRGRKERLVDETSHLLVVVREGQVVASLSSGDLNVLVRLGGSAASGYGADALAVVVEGIFPMVKENPVTEKPWESGDAEKLWREHNGVARGWVSEVAITTIAARDGSTHVEVWPFNKRDDSVVWGETQISVDSDRLAERLVAQFGGPVMDPSRVPDPGDGFVGDPDNGPFYDPEAGRVAIDIGCSRMLGNQLRDHGDAFLIVNSDQQAEDLISEGLASWQVEVWVAPLREDHVDG